MFYDYRSFYLGYLFNKNLASKNKTNLPAQASSKIPKILKRFDPFQWSGPLDSFHHMEAIDFEVKHSELIS